MDTVLLSKLTKSQTYNAGTFSYELPRSLLMDKFIHEAFHRYFLPVHIFRNSLLDTWLESILVWND